MKKSLLLIICVLFLIPLSNTPAHALEKLVIQGSTTVYPIAKKTAAAFKKEHPEVDVVLNATGSGDGIRALITGTANIANASRFIKQKEIKMVLEKGALPVPFQVAYDCIVPVVHPSNPIRTISMENLRKVYAGEIRNWKILGGPSAPISIISRDSSSGTFGVWKKMVLKGKEQTPQLKLMESNSAIVKSVKADKHAIGYVGIGYLDGSVKPLRVNNIAASTKTALSGAYPITRPLYMFTKNWPKGVVKKYINFVLDPQKGQKLVKASGFLPLFNTSATASTAMAAPAAQPAAITGAKATMTLFQDYAAMTWNEKVLRLQTNLKALDYPVGPLDGVWGKKTLAAYQQFQKDNGLEPDGKIMYQWIQLMELNQGLLSDKS